jgi:hypothetical protein
MIEEGTIVMDAEDFLDLVWGEREAWVDLPAKVGAYWVPYPIEWPQDLVISNRIDQSLRDGEDLYYSVAMFAERGRNKEDVLPLSWLWADLDEVHPSVATGMGFMPTVAIESSPGRYQALWKLSKEHGPKVIEKLNRGLTYLLGADRGGWDLTQVLRIPSTRNFKYPGAPPVRMLWANDLTYQAQDVWSAVKGAVPAAELAGVVDQILPKRDIPHKALRLLAAKPEETVDGEKSDRLWELNCLLAEAGCTEDEIEDLVIHSAWNKFAGRGSSASAQLRRDIHRARQHVLRKARERKREAQAVKADGGPPPSDPSVVHWVTEGRLPAVTVETLVGMKIEEPLWLVEDIWTAGAHGIVGGEPKTGKSTLALALGLAVASGKPFLGEFDVIDPGPVLMVQEENTERMLQDWTRKLAHYSGVSLKGLPMRVVTKAGFDLAEEAHQEILEAEIAETRPKLVILDPLAMMFGDADLDKSNHVTYFTKKLIQLGHVYKCSIMLVHHMAKKSQNTAGRRAGQRLAGSYGFHAFVESALYPTRIDAPKDNWTGVTIEREFRYVEPMPNLNLAWHFDSIGSTGMQMEITSQTRVGFIEELVSEGRKTLIQLSEESGYGKRAIMRYADKSPVLKRTRGRGSTIWVEYIGTNGASTNSKNR